MLLIFIYFWAFFSRLFGLLCILFHENQIHFFFSFISISLSGFTIYCEYEWIISIQADSHVERMCVWREKNLPKKNQELAWWILFHLMHRHLTISHCVHAAVNKIVHFVVKTTTKKKRCTQRRNEDPTVRKISEIGRWEDKTKSPVRWLWSQEKATQRRSERESKKESERDGKNVQS